MSPAFAATNLLNSPEFLIGTVLLVLVLLAGAIVIWWLDNWRKKQAKMGIESTESLTHCRDLFERGEITETEYKRIRDKVSKQMRQEVGLPVPVPAVHVVAEPLPPVVPAVPPDPTP